MDDAKAMAKEHVRLVEVGPRDGLQNIKANVPTSTKVELISRLRQTGLETIELTSMVSERAVPQLADARQLLAHEEIQDSIAAEKVRHPVLVPNLKGLDRALDLGVKEVAVFVSASEAFSRANIKCSIDEGLSQARQVAEKAIQAGCAVRGYISCVFECPFDGRTPVENVSRIVKDLLDMGCYEISLGDTLGVGIAVAVRALLKYLIKSGVPMHQLAGHFHDTYGQAVSNIWTSYDCGVRVFDTSVAGLGGCPFCPGSSGNAATEDVVFLFENANVDTGVDLSELAKVGAWITKKLDVPNRSRAGAALVSKHGPNLIRDRFEEPKLVEEATGVDMGSGLTLTRLLQTCRWMWKARYQFALTLQL